MPKSLEQIRTENPLYQGIPDNSLFEMLHEDYYSSIPKDEFAKAVGYDYKPPTPNRSAIGEIGHQLAGGTVVDFNKQVGQATQAFTNPESPVYKWAQENIDKANALAQQYELDESKHGLIANTLAKGARAIPSSVATMALYAIPYVGEVLGPAVTVALFGGSAYKETYDKAKEAGATDDVAQLAALKSAGYQGVGEVVSNALQLRALGALNGGVADTVSEGIKKAVTAGSLKAYGKATMTAAVGEPVTETLQNIGTNEAERTAGIKNTPSNWDIAKESSQATFGMVALLSPLGLVGHYHNAVQAKAIDDVLSNPNSGTPEARTAVVNKLYSDLKGVPQADEWYALALKDVENNRPIRREPTYDPQDVLDAGSVDEAIHAATQSVEQHQAEPLAIPVEVAPQKLNTHAEIFQQAADTNGVPVEVLKAFNQVEAGGRLTDNGKPIRPLDKNGNKISNAVGPMQIIGHYFPQFDEDRLAVDPQYNVDSGAKILKGYYDKTPEALSELQRWRLVARKYFGSPDMQKNTDYANKIMAALGNPVDSNETLGETNARTTESTGGIDTGPVGSVDENLQSVEATPETSPATEEVTNAETNISPQSEPQRADISAGGVTNREEAKVSASPAATVKTETTPTIQDKVNEEEAQNQAAQEADRRITVTAGQRSGGTENAGANRVSSELPAQNKRTTNDNVSGARSYVPELVANAKGVTEFKKGAATALYKSRKYTKATHSIIPAPDNPGMFQIVKNPETPELPEKKQSTINIRNKPVALNQISSTIEAEHGIKVKAEQGDNGTVKLTFPSKYATQSFSTLTKELRKSGNDILAGATEDNLTMHVRPRAVKQASIEDLSIPQENIKPATNEKPPKLPVLELPTTAPTETTAALPKIITQKKAAYIAQQIKAYNQEHKNALPNIRAEAHGKIKAGYEAALDAAHEALTFEQYKAVNPGLPEATTRRAYEQLHPEETTKPKGEPNAKQEQEATRADERSSAQSKVRQEGEDTTGSGAGVRRGRQEEGNIKQEEFKPTHELNDGTLVVKQEDGSYIDKQGDEYVADEDATPIEKVKKETSAIQRNTAPIKQEPKVSKPVAVIQKKAVSKLRAVAQSTLDKAQEKQNQDRQTNTAKRAREAEYAIDNALRQEALARTMFNLADAQERGETKVLSRVTNRAQVETLQKFLTQAMYAHDTKLKVSYGKQQQQKGRPATTEDVKFAEYPEARLHESNVLMLKSELAAVRGGKRLSREINRTITNEQYAQVKKLLGVKDADYRIGWYPIEQLTNQNRLKALGIHNTEELQAALREFIQFKQAKKEEDAVAKAERALVGGNHGVDFFPTPKALSSRMVEMADIQPGDTVLEPSAGNGNIADAMKAAGANVDTIEISSALRDVLKAKGYPIVENNFNDYTAKDKYDAIVMNPPFSNNQDSEHIQKAYDMLKPGGRLVAIAGEGVFFRSDKKSQAFREWLDSHDADVEKLPPNTFQDKSLINTTGVNARLISIIKQEESKFSLGVTPSNETAETISAALPNYTKKLIAAGKLEVLNNTDELPSNVLNRGELLSRKPFEGSASRYDVPVSEQGPRKPFQGTRSRAEENAQPITPTKDKRVPVYSTDASNAEGLYDPVADKLYLFANNISKENLNSVLSHELFHRALATDSKLKAATERFDADFQKRFNNAAKGVGSKIELAAYKRVITAETSLADQQEEFKAYIVTEYQKNPESLPARIVKVIKDWLASIRIALIKAGLDFKTVKSLTPADLVAMSRYGANVQGGTVNDSNIVALASKQGYEGTDKGGAFEWLRAKAKGLDMSDAARMKRAEAMGFDTNKVWYHGTHANEFDSFILPGKKTKRQTGGKALFFADTPNIANTFAEYNNGWLLPVYLKQGDSFNFKNNEHVEKISKFIKANFDTIVPGALYSPDSAITFIKNGDYGLLENPKIMAWFKKNGFSSVHLKERFNDKTIFVFNPNQIRSIYAAFDPDFKDSGNLLASATAARFYSALRRGFVTAPDKIFNGPASQVKMWLNSNKDKLGIKADEIYWTGLTDYLDAAGKAKVSKQDVLDYLDVNGVQIVDVVLGNFTKSEEKEYSNLEKQYQKDGVLTDSEFKRFKELSNKRLNNTAPKYADSNYVLHGGKDAKELIVTIPTVEPYNETDATHYGDVGKGKQVAWVRMDSRTDADGNQGIFVNEFQSQRGQQGRRIGFASLKNVDVYAKWIEPTVPIGKNQDDYTGYWEVYKKNDNSLVARIDEYDDVSEEEAIKKAIKSFKLNKIPPAPFITTANNKATDAYISLLMKKAISAAVDEGKTFVAWTTGTQQADFYDLSKTFDRITWYERDKKLTAYDKKNKQEQVINENLKDESEIENYIGKELADRLLKKDYEKVDVLEKALGKSKTLSGRGLVFTAPWTAAMYGDENGMNAQEKPAMITQAASEIARKMGGKIGSVEISQGGEFDDNYNVNDVKSKQPALIITPEMRDKIKAEGMPLFSRQAVTEQETALPEETSIDKLQRRWQDTKIRLKVLQEHKEMEAAKEGGYTGSNLNEARAYMNDHNIINPVRDETNAYDAEYRRAGIVTELTKDFENKVMQPLIKEMEAAKISMHDISQFLLMQHAEEANTRIQKLKPDQPDATAYGITTDEANAALAEFEARPEYRELKRISNEWRSLTDDILDMKVDAGLISPETRDAYHATFNLYVPVKGIEEEGGSPSGTGKGLSVYNAEKRRLGHGIRDERVLENIIKDYEKTINLIEKNKVTEKLAKFIEEVDDPEIGTVGKPERRQVFKPGATHYMVEYHGSDVKAFDNIADAREFVNEESQKNGRKKSDFYIDKTKDDGRVILQGKPLLGDNEVQYYKDGKAIRVQLNDELLARAAKNLGIDQAGKIIETAQLFNRNLTKVYTAYSPTFIIKNPIRDAVQGFITNTSKLGFKTATDIFKQYPHAMKELYKHFKEYGSSAEVDRYRKAGGSTGAAYLSDTDRIGKDIMDAYNEYAGAVDTYHRIYEQAIRDGKSEAQARFSASVKAFKAGIGSIPIIGHFLKFMENANSVTENALRLATFTTLVNEKDASGKRIYSDSQAATYAKDLMNFNRKGELTTQAGALYLFFNPNMQGTHVLLSALTDAKYAKQARVLTGTIALSAFLAAEAMRGGGDDDERKWRNLPDNLKDRNLIFGAGDVKVMLPVPYGYGIFHSVGNALSDVAHGQNVTKTGIRLVASMFDNFSPIGNPIDSEHDLFQILPTIPKMIMAPSVNENNFGSPIQPIKWVASKPDSQNMYRGTKGTVYDDLAQIMNNLSGGNKYKAGIVDVSPETLRFWMSSLTGGTGQFVVDSINSMKMVTQGVPPSNKDIPIIRSFTHEIGVSDARQGFWNAASEVDKAAQAFRDAKKAHDYKAMREIQKDDKRLLALSKLISSQAKLAKALRDAEDEIKLSNIPLRQKKTRLKLLEIRETNVYNKVLSIYNK